MSKYRPRKKFLAAFFKKRAGRRGKAPARVPQDAKSFRGSAMRCPEDADSLFAAGRDAAAV